MQRYVKKRETTKTMSNGPQQNVDITVQRTSRKTRHNEEKY
jgi:hypothetical protein